MSVIILKLNIRQKIQKCINILYNKSCSLKSCQKIVLKFTTIFFFFIKGPFIDIPAPNKLYSVPTKKDIEGEQNYT